MTRRTMYAKKLAWVAVALVTAFCCQRACAETWTWIGGSTNGWANSAVTAGANNNMNREWQEGYNWQDSSGVRGDDWFAADHGYRPADGDTIIFDTSVVNEHTHCMGGVKYGAIIVRGASNWESYYGSHPNVQEGGSMRLESPIFARLQYLWPMGTTTVHVVAGGTMRLSYTQHDKTTRPVVKTGGGIWELNKEYGSFWTTFDLQGGTVACMSNNQFKTSTSFTFNGPDTKLDISGFNQEIAGAALAETSEANGHAITSTTPACLTLSGAQDDTTFSGNIAGAATICWNPTDASKTLTLSASALDTTGTLIVSNGVLKLMGGDVLPNGFLDIEGGTLEVPANRILVMRSGSLVQGDVAVADGIYSSVAAPGRTAVSWLVGDGVLMVIDPTGGMSTPAIWTGTGPMTTAANWNGAAELPDVYGGTLCMSVAGGTYATVDDNVWIRGVDIASGVSAFSFLPSDAHTLWLGGQGLTTPGVGGTYSIQAPFGILRSQAWTVGANDTLALKAPLTTVMRGTVTMGGTGMYDFQAGSPDLANDLAVVSSKVNVRADYALGGATGTTSFTNATVKFFGTTQARPLVFSITNTAYFFAIDAGTTNVFNGNVFLACTNGTGTLMNSRGGTEIFAGGLDVDNHSSVIQFTGDGVFIVTNKPIARGALARHNVTGGELHLFAPSNQFNVGQQGWVSGKGTTLYTHVTNAIYNSLMNLSGNRPGGATWDLCGCDQQVANIQCGRGDNGSGEIRDKWKTSTEPGTIRSDLPAVLHIVDIENRTNPSGNHSPSSTNWAYFVGRAGISKDGSYRSHWLMQECCSSGMVQVTQGELYIAKRFVDGAGNDYGQGSWPNASKAVAKGTGTLVFQHSACIGKRTDVEISEGGKLRLEAGVQQVCHDLYLPDGNGGMVKQPLGTWGSSASGAYYKNDTYFSGSGILWTVGKGAGLLLYVR